MLQFSIQLFGDDGYTYKLPLEIETTDSSKQDMDFKRKIRAADIGWVSRLNHRYNIIIIFNFYSAFSFIWRKGHYYRLLLPIMILITIIIMFNLIATVTLIITIINFIVSSPKYYIQYAIYYVESKTGHFIYHTDIYANNRYST